MASLYTKAANRKKLAEAGMAKLGETESATEQEQEPPYPPQKVRRATLKNTTKTGD